jgi:hypothetical protein
MTNQEAFDRVWHWFVVEGHAQSKAPGSMACLYRGPDGLKCAVGVLIPDEEYQPSLEGKVTAQIIHDVPALKDLTCTCLGDMQRVHDEYGFKADKGPSFTDHMKAGLTRIAQDWHLQVPQ